MNTLRPKAAKDMGRIHCPTCGERFVGEYTVQAPSVDGNNVPLQQLYIYDCINKHSWNKFSDLTFLNESDIQQNQGGLTHIGFDTPLTATATATNTDEITRTSKYTGPVSQSHYRPLLDTQELRKRW